jgi:hypothetical protein
MGGPPQGLFGIFHSASQRHLSAKTGEPGVEPDKTAINISHRNEPVPCGDQWVEYRTKDPGITWLRERLCIAARAIDMGK